MTIQDRTDATTWPDGVTIQFDGVITGGEMYDRIATFTATTTETAPLELQRQVNDLVLAARGNDAPAHQIVWHAAS